MPLLPETHLHKIIAGILDEYEPVDGRLGAVDVIEIAMRVGRRVAEDCADQAQVVVKRRNSGTAGEAYSIWFRIRNRYGLDEPTEDVRFDPAGLGEVEQGEPVCKMCGGRRWIPQGPRPASSTAITYQQPCPACTPCDVCDVCGFSGGDGNLGYNSLPCPKCVGKEGE